jgi:glycosyltransferase involved in cell wall biosynthesis
MDEYRRHDPEARLYFAGDGEDRPRLEKRIAELNLGAQVKVTGFLKPSEIVSYINAADAAVFGSFVEGWSVSMLEALACGKAIVSTGVSGTESMVMPGENGFVVNSRDPVKFAEAMRRAVRLPDAARVSASIARDFDLTRMGERLGRLWRPFGQHELNNANTTGPQLLRVVGAER